MYDVDAEKLLKLKGVIELDSKTTFDHKREEQEHYLSIASSFLQNSLNSEEVDR